MTKQSRSATQAGQTAGARRLPLPRSLTLRLVGVAAIWMVLALTAGGAILSWAFRDYAVSDFDAKLTQTLDALVGAASVQPDGSIAFTRQLSDQRFREAYSGYYWQITRAGQEPVISRSLWDQRLNVDLQSPSRPARQAVFRKLTGPDGQTLKAAIRDVSLPGSNRRLRFISAADTAQVRGDIRRFDTLIAWSLGALGAGLMVAVVIQVAVALHPLRRIRSGLAAVRSGRARRLDEAFPTEIVPLVTELNALLSHNEAIIERARTHAGNLAHALKTPLSILSNEAQARADETPLAGIVQRQTDAMQRHVDHHLRRARAAGAGLGVVTALDETVASLVRAMEKIHRDKTLAFDVQVSSDLRVAANRQDLEEIVGNLLDNACKWGRNQIRLSADRQAGDRRDMVTLTVEDDGPGVPEAARGSLFERGHRLDETIPGSGLGLAIAQDIAELNDGSITLADADLGGLAVKVALPAAG